MRGSVYAAAVAMVVLASSSASADVSLPNAHCGTTAGTNCLQFDDFTVYSLSLLNLQAGAGPISPSDPFDVSTNGQALQNSLVVGTGVNGQGSVNTDQIGGGLVDNAYNTPNSNGGLVNFRMGSTNEGAQGANIPSNSSETWDVNVGALLTYLNGGKLTFFFNLNQTNTTSYLNNNEDALGWLSVTLSDTTGAHASKTFWLDGDACNGVLGAPNSPNCDPSQSFAQPGVGQPGNPNANILPANPSHNEWAYIHGQICANAAGALLHFGSCTGADVNGITLDQNLGANTAAFALYSDALQQWLLSGDYNKMSVDLRMAAENNGYEQLLIQASHIPEPVTVLLFGAGLAGIGSLRRRRTKTA
jgi:hypothetical protein